VHEGLGPGARGVGAGVGGVGAGGVGAGATPHAAARPWKEGIEKCRQSDRGGVRKLWAVAAVRVRKRYAPDVGKFHIYWHVTGSETENDVGPTPPVGSQVN